MDLGVQGFHFRPPLDTTMRLPNPRRLRATLPVVLLYLALPCMALPWLGGCAKQQEPIGTVPSDDVPAPVAPARDADANPCEAMSGAELEACRRQHPQSSQPPVEPTHTPPPDAGR